MIVLSYIYWDPRPEIFYLPIVHWPILWYGVLFALGFAVGFPLLSGILTRFFTHDPSYRKEHLPALKKRAVWITDKYTMYVIVGTVAGARLGHFLFYEHPREYFNDPWQIFRIWEGGLASHGGAIGIILATMIFTYRMKIKDVDWIRMLDFLTVPAAFGGFCIRVGNFFNQEILGTPTNVPWAVLFGHPADRSLPVPRHPVQLYEAAFNLAVFFILWHLSYRSHVLEARGRLVGLFLILVFGFRFAIEYLKVEQSRIVGVASTLTMGQALSIPAITLGIALFFLNRIRRSS